MDLEKVKDVFDHVTKKQKLCSSRFHEAIERISQEIEHTLLQLQSADASTTNLDTNAVLSDLNTKFKEMAPLYLFESAQKELNVACIKYPKQLEKYFNPDISKAYRNVDFDSHTINHIIASHLYREGLFEMGDLFAEEAEEKDATTLKSPFIELHHILQALESHNLDPALNWAMSNRKKLGQNGSDLELKLHKLRFVEILQTRDRKDAVTYARTHISPFHSSHLAEIQKLMICLLWAGKLNSSPYADLLFPVNYENLSGEFIRQFCNLLGQSFHSPLRVTITAGIQGLPTLLKLMNVMVAKKQEWHSLEQLPVPIDLGKDFQFHSVFVCPVSRDEASEENPPTMISCGHVLCKKSITKLSNSGTNAFKCPYCPNVIQASHCKQLFF